MANPTIGATTPRIQYTATASQTVFTVPFEFLANADLAVYVNGTLKTLTTDYTLTGANTTGGGSLTFVTGRTAGEIVTILGNLAYSRNTNKYTKFGLLPAEVLEADFDALQVQSKQLALADQFALRAPLTDTGSPSMTLPVVATRASKALGFDASGNPTVSASSLADIDSTVQIIDTLNALPAGASSSISYQPAGTGAVTTTVQAKLREVVSVKDFGAVGNGVTNDAAAVQAALTYASANGKAVQFVSGETYNCTGATLSVSCSIYGNSATIKGYLLVTGNDLVLRDFSILGTNTLWAIYLFGSTIVPTTRYYRQKLQNVKIAFDTGVATADSLGIYATNIDNLSITGCNVQYGIQMVGCTDYLIESNVLDGNNYANNNELIHASLKSVGQILNNTFKDSLDNYIDLYTSGAKTVVSNNRFLGNKCRFGTAVEIKVSLTDTPSNTSSDTNGWAEQILISNNYFGNTVPMSAGYNSVITVYYIDSRAAPSFSWAQTPRNIAIVDNIFDGVDASALGAGYVNVINLDTVAGVIVQGNTFRDINLSASTIDTSSCVWIENCQDVVVDGNRMSAKNATGVSLHRDCTNITVSNNHMLQDLNKSYTLNYGIRITKEGVKADPTVTYSKFVNNTVYCSIAAFRQLYTAAGYMNDCVVTGNVFKEQSSFQNINRCVVNNNKFYVGSTRFFAAEFGNATAICAHNIVANNQVESNTTTKQPGIYITKMRGSSIMQNTVRNTTYGIAVVGSNTAGELDYLNIKDNFSISQTQINFPQYSSMNAADTATLQAVNNQKIT